MNSPSRRPLRAPAESGGTLIEPPAAAAGAVLAEAAARRKGAAADVLGRPLSELARAARGRLLEDAARYTRQYRDVEILSDPRYVILAGHQPELFHPGVWFKHFVLDRLAREHSAVAVNLVVDNDICKQTTVRVPTGTASDPRIEAVPFDAHGVVIPWEERPILDRAVFDDFSRRTAAMISPLVSNPLVTELWPLVREAARREPTLGRALSQGRHAYEARVGLTTLELPLSDVCRTGEFARFALWLLANATRVREAYNRAVHAYRRENRIRSASHPVPDLVLDGDWCEAPLRVWSRGDPQRRRLFVERRRQSLVVTDRYRWSCELPLRADGDPAAALSQLAELDRAGIRVRPRALVTTLYARVVLGDLFVHGIGGAKYDEVTDELVRQLFDLEPPAYLTATATLHLPIPHPRGAAADLRTVEKRRRDLLFHAEAAASGRDGDAWNEAVARKRHWIEESRRLAAMPVWDRALAQACHQGITAANEALSRFTEPERESLLEVRDALRDRLRAETLLESRDYAFCLFPREYISAAFAQKS